jgi:predicted 2-oxoglutarate/Fe(II)-dependent dioxygenase YbiX
VINITSSARGDPKRLEFDNRIFQAAAVAGEAYVRAFPHVSVSKDTTYDLLRYQTGGFYTQHVDHFLDAPRILSCSWLLNDDFEGGEFAFFDGSLKLKMEAGDAVLFPSNFMFPHEVLPVTKGKRSSSVTWFM